MRYVIAASTERMVETCRQGLRDLSNVEFRVGSVPETGKDCDAAILSSPLAHERYGGIPRMGVAQVLANTRGDGAPGIILATPLSPVSAVGVTAGRLEVEEHVVYVLSACLEAFLNQYSECNNESSVLIHLEAAAIDQRDLSAPIRGIRRVLSRSAVNDE
ncbi:hypothetical protein ABZS29_30850 [Kribbella sp. NPDC005582]|uniref:hypothetical protein n=1 Tax=Kribbella sp. NPDC005582 TaxID=3156893 RepID=UPI0033A97891